MAGKDAFEMKDKAADRRVIRTRSGLQQALLTLIRKKGYDAVTVEDICGEANVGRSTFYLHFASKDALKRSGLDHLRRELLERQRQVAEAGNGNATSRFGFSLALFEHARDHVDLYRALAGSTGGNVALDGIREILSELVRRDLQRGKRAHADAVPSDFVVEYLVGAYTAVLIGWLDGGAKRSPQKMAEMFRRLAIEGVG